MKTSPVVEITNQWPSHLCSARSAHLQRAVAEARAMPAPLGAGGSSGEPWLCSQPQGGTALLPGPRTGARQSGAAKALLTTKNALSVLLVKYQNHNKGSRGRNWRGLTNCQRGWVCILVWHLFRSPFLQHRGTCCSIPHIRVSRLQTGEAAVPWRCCGMTRRQLRRQSHGLGEVAAERSTCQRCSWSLALVTGGDGRKERKNRKHEL